MCALSNAEGHIITPLHTMLPDGTVIMCCNDYSMSGVLGNLLEQSWDSIVTGGVYRAFVQNFQDSTKKYACHFCHQAQPVRKAETSFPYLPPLYRLPQIDINNYIHTHMHTSVENICIFGLGSLFENTYFQGGWSELCQANLLSDSKITYETVHNGIKVVPPTDLLSYRDLLVISYVARYEQVHSELNKMGIHNIISIFDIVNAIVSNEGINFSKERTNSGGRNNHNNED